MICLVYSNGDLITYKCALCDSGLPFLLAVDLKCEYDEIFTDYPVVESNNYDSIKNIWTKDWFDESIKENDLSRSGIPTINWCKKNNINVKYVLDVAISRNGKIVWGFKISDGCGFFGYYYNKSTYSEEHEPFTHLVILDNVLNETKNIVDEIKNIEFMETHINSGKNKGSKKNIKQKYQKH